MLYNINHVISRSSYNLFPPKIKPLEPKHSASLPKIQPGVIIPPLHVLFIDPRIPSNLNYLTTSLISLSGRSFTSYSDLFELLGGSGGGFSPSNSAIEALYKDSYDGEAGSLVGGAERES